jgi:hypothetical protein
MTLTGPTITPSTTWARLPREDGHINTSASFGQWVIVEVTYNTDPEGTWVDDDDYSNKTLHGPFVDEAEAQAWIEDHAPDDTDIKDVDTLLLNAVR